MKRVAFKIPIQSEVRIYIKNKMGWPDKFCDHYSEKFWNHYQASGWKLSSGNAIKDWQACFNSQWKQLKFKEDIELLNSLTGRTGTTQAPPKVAPGMATDDFDKLDLFLSEYKEHPTAKRFEDFGAWYDFMKANRLLMPLTKEKIEELKMIYNNDNQKCRCACVQITLDQYAKSGWTIFKTMEVRKRLV